MPRTVTCNVSMAPDIGRIFAASYDTRSQGQAPVSDATIMDSSHFANVAFHGIAITDGKVYLAFRLPDDS